MLPREPRHHRPDRVVVHQAAPARCGLDRLGNVITASPIDEVVSVLLKSTVLPPRSLHNHGKLAIGFGGSWASDCGGGMPWPSGASVSDVARRHSRRGEV